jgi:DNA replication protein DnaC
LVMGKVQALKIPLHCEKHSLDYEIDDTPFARRGLNFAPGAFCPECKLESENASMERELTREATERAERIEARLHNLSIGERFKHCTWDDYQTPLPKMAASKKTCQRYVESFNPSIKADNNMMFVGSPGTGKNMLAAIICMEVIRRGFTAEHSTAMKIVRSIKDSWREREVSEQETIKRYYHPDLLVIDEIGVQFGSDTEKLYLTEIINERYEQYNPTILISNLTIPQIEAVLGKRAVDRFYEGNSKVLVFDWSSYRRQGGEKNEAFK